MNETEAVLKTLQQCEKVCLEQVEERRVMRCFREADGAMGCFERIRKLILNYKGNRS